MPPRREPLRPREEELLRGISEFVRTSGMAPTQRDMVAMVGSGRSFDAMKRALTGLLNKGYVTQQPGMARSLKVKRIASKSRER